jgi:hypothetical protein
MQLGVVQSACFFSRACRSWDRIPTCTCNFNYFLRYWHAGSTYRDSICSRSDTYKGISEKILSALTSHGIHVIGFCRKPALDRFVTSHARDWQVEWPVNLICKLCDLSAPMLQVVWLKCTYVATLLTTPLYIWLCFDRCIIWWHMRTLLRAIVGTRRCKPNPLMQVEVFFETGGNKS